MNKKAVNKVAMSKRAANKAAIRAVNRVAEHNIILLLKAVPVKI